jgi:hypothetical protein
MTAHQNRKKAHSSGVEPVDSSLAFQNFTTILRFAPLPFLPTRAEGSALIQFLDVFQMMKTRTIHSLLVMPSLFAATFCTHAAPADLSPFRGADRQHLEALFKNAWAINYVDRERHEWLIRFRPDGTFTMRIVGNRHNVESQYGGSFALHQADGIKLDLNPRLTNGTDYKSDTYPDGRSQTYTLFFDTSLQRTYRAESLMFSLCHAGQSCDATPTQPRFQICTSDDCAALGPQSD